MISVFTAHLNLAEAHLALNGPFRKNWVKHKVDIICEQGWNGVLVEDAVRSLAWVFGVYAFPWTLSLPYITMLSHLYTFVHYYAHQLECHPFICIAAC